MAAKARWVAPWPRPGLAVPHDGPMRIVIGMDGSDNAREALRWAVDEAELHGATVQALLVWSFLDQQHTDPAAPFDPTYDADAARSTLETWVSEALGGQHQVELVVACDLTPRGLLGASDAADLLVLGARGRGGFASLLLGSVSQRVVESATRPVAVVRESGPVRGGQVLVGVDGSASSVDALRWAAGEAKARDAELHVVYAWRLQIMSASPWVPTIPEDVEAMSREVLDQAMADPALTDVRAQGHLHHGSAGRALVERSDGAALVVVGSRGQGRIGSLLLGSVTRQLLHHASCPVVVV